MTTMTTITATAATTKTATTTDHADIADGVGDLGFPDGADLALSRGTDFYALDELLSGPERDLRDRVRRWCDTEVSPVAADYLGTGGVPRRPGDRVRPGWASPAPPSSGTAAPGCPTWPRG